MNYSSTFMSYRVYRINASGEASWALNREAYSATEALLKGHRTAPDLVPEGSTFIVIPDNSNPNNAQVVFTLERAEAPVRAVAATL